MPLPDTARFAMLTLHEPAKELVRGFEPGDPLDRQAFAIVLDRADGSIHEGIASVSFRRVDSWERVDAGQGQPSMLMEEMTEIDRMVKDCPEWVAAVRKRGVTNVELVQVDPFSAGQFGFEPEQGRRIVRAIAFARRHPLDNGYAHPLENLVAYVDLNRREVIEVVDGDVVPVPLEDGTFGKVAGRPPRADLKPLDVVQPEGVSFQVDGHEISWQRWRFRIAVTPREGLVLHRVSYEDRPILYRASLAEMVVPYGDPSISHFWRSAFDAGEYGMGKLSDSLALGCDCLGVIHYFDAVVAGDDGEPVTIPNAVCLHEEDYSVLWKHTDFRVGTSDVRRSRRLVVSHYANIGNYDYGFYWYFYLDGSIQLETKLNGIIQTSAVQPGQTPEYGDLVAPGLAGPIHQHLFCVRLDFELDGERNAVYEVEAEAVPTGPDNRHGTAFRAKRTLLESELGARREADPLRGRYWTIVNRERANRLGRPVGYKLVPQANPLLLSQPDSYLARRATFATKHLWVTKYHPEERFAAGDYPNQHAGGSGLPEWVQDDASIVDEDIVVWHTFGPTHIVRPEDWPIMPVEYTGFWLKPVGFFERNPALDVPESSSHLSCHAEGGAHHEHHGHHDHSH